MKHIFNSYPFTFIHISFLYVVSRIIKLTGLVKNNIRTHIHTMSTTNDYIDTLYDLEDQLSNHPYTRDYSIRRQDGLNGQKILAINVTFGNPVTVSDPIYFSIEAKARILCEMAVHVQRFDSSTVTFVDNEAKIIYYYECTA